MHALPRQWFFFRRCKEREGGGRGGGRPFRKEKENGRERDGRGPERPPPGGLGIWGKGGFGGAGDRRHGPPISAVRRSDFKFLTSKLVAESAFFKIFETSKFRERHMYPSFFFCQEYPVPECSNGTQST